MSVPVITASVVLYRTDPTELRALIAACTATPLIARLIVIDNSPDRSLGEVARGGRVEYRPTGANLGYGRAHNLALREVLESSDYHIVINPDVLFAPETIERLVGFMESAPDVGLVMPKIVYGDGSIQYLAKLLPTPANVFARRFVPVRSMVARMNERYELRFSGYGHVMDVPYLSGCFMFLRTAALREVGLFDERFFMYFEDTDLTRRIHERRRTVYFPDAQVVHGFRKQSYTSLRLLAAHVASSIRYFSKWGWCFDSDRARINAGTVEKIGAIGKGG